MRTIRALAWMTAIWFSPVMASSAQDQGKDASVAADHSPHQVRFVKVAPDVTLEVLDWGGTGRPLILLAGLGSDAHAFDDFAPRLVPKYHIYGITRRGFGASSKPKPDCENYSADRLGDDVLAVIEALRIERPVLAGHSIAGEELSSIGTRFPEKVTGLIYLDAGYAYAYYDAKSELGDPIVDTAALKKELNGLAVPAKPGQYRAQVAHLLETTLPRVERDLQEFQRQLNAMPDNTPAPPMNAERQIGTAIQMSVNIYGGVKCPVLAIFADPHNMPAHPGEDPAAHAKHIADDQARTSAQADAFQTGNSNARVVRLANADHFVYRSNEADVIREINAFIATLP